MRNLLTAWCSAAALCIALSVQAQEVAWGAQLKNKRYLTTERIVAEDAAGFYVLRFDNRRISRTIPVIEHYDHNNKLKYVSPQPLFADKSTFYEYCWQYNGQLYLYYSALDTRNNVERIGYQVINKATGKPQGKPTELLTVPAKRDGGWVFRANYSSVRFAASPDSSYAALLHTPPYEGGSLLRDKEPASFSIKMMDKTMGEVWKKNVTLKYDSYLADILDVVVTSKGEAHVLIKVFDEKRREKREGEVNYEYKLLSFNAEGEQRRENSLQLDDKFISDITIKVNAKDQVICAGFYSDKGSFSIKGSFLFALDAATIEVTKKGYKEFDIDFVTKLIGKRKAEKGKELYRYYLDDLILRSDGGAVLIGEQFYVITHTYYTGTGASRVQQTRTTYIYEDIIIININPDASIDWATNIPKNQSSSNTTYSSYAKAIVGGRIHFIYNQRISKNAPVMISSLDTKGEVITKQLFSNREAGVVTIPKLCRQTGKQSMIVYGARGKKYKYGRLNF